MKKQLVAIMLGLTLSFTSVGVFAEEAETETETETENAAISAGIALLDAAAGTELEVYGKIVIINDDGTLVINTGDLIEDEEDTASATLELSDVYIQFTVTDGVSSGQLTDLLTITAVEADAEEAADKDAEEDAETTADEETEEDAGDSETESESETEETIETEAFDVSDIQVGDIICFTINSAYEIDTLTLISTQADDIDSENTSDAGETATEAETEA
ncbi:MAG: hypothetical protein LUD12_14520 [Lachnospiraceae bacterium]|nr:hypothetical protein [Lachnospiraceae bacterium]